MGEEPEKSEIPSTRPMTPAQLRMRRPSLLPVKRRIDQGRIRSTETLVEALNNSETHNKAPLRRWFRQYISWFSDQRAEDLREGDLEELAILARLDPTLDQNKALLRDYLTLLCNKTKEQGYGDEAFMQLLDYSLQAIDPSVFEANPKVLIDLGHYLLEKINPENQKQQFTQSTYPAYEHTLYALHQTLVLIRQIDPESLNTTKKDGLYAQFRECLENIKSKAQDYAFVYQSELLLQGLTHLGTPLSKTQEILRKAKKVLHGLKGGYHLYRVLRGLVSLEMRGEDLGTSVEHFKKAFEDEQLAKHPWYELLQVLSQASLVTSGDPPQYKSLEIGLKALEHLKLSQKRSRQPLHYGVVKLLAELALHSSDKQLRQQSKAWLSHLANNKEWTRDEEVKNAIEGYLKALEAIKQESDLAPVQASGRVFTEVVQSINKEAEEAQQYSQVIPPMRESDHREQLQNYYKSAYGQVNQLFGDEKRMFPIDSTQFVLAVIEEKEEQGEEAEQQKGPKDQIDLLHGHKVKTFIQLEDLFKEQDVQRVGVEGLPGMGKTTLAQKLAYLWAQGQYPGFEAVYVLPVRNLKKEVYDSLQSQDHPLARAIARECFPQLGSPEAQMADKNRFESLVKRIAQQLESQKTLVVLDGLDEQEGANELLLKAAQRGRHKLLATSRPYGLEEFQHQVDLKVNMLGLTQAQIAAYVHSYLQNEKQARELLKFLQQHPSLGPMVQVPVTLNMVCTLWEKEPEALQSIGSSRTALYQTLTEYIWERYDQKYKEKVLENQDRDALFETLGQIALAGMEAGEALISGRTIKKALRKVPNNKQMQKLIQGAGLLENMQSSQLITSVGPTYAFPHLTFQEYFAGKALARMLLEGNAKEQEDAVNFLDEHKYESRYEVTLTFMAGEVYEKGGLAGAQKLLRALDENKEIVGVQHTLLQLRCLNEWLGMGAKARTLQKLEKEFGMMKAFNALLKKGLKDKRDNALHQTLIEAFPHLGRVLGKSQAVAIYKAALEHKSFGKPSNAIRALTAISQAAPDQARSITPRLLERLIDKDYSVRSDAQRALAMVVKAVPSEAKAIIAYLQKMLRHKDPLVRSNATDAILDIAKVAPSEAKTLIPNLLEILEDEKLNEDTSAMPALAAIFQAFPDEAKAVIPKLLEAMGSDYDLTSEVAEETLAMVAKVFPDEAKVLIPKLLGMLKDDKDPHGASHVLAAIVQAYPVEAKSLTTILLENLKKDTSVNSYTVRVIVGVAKVAPSEAKALIPIILEIMGGEDYWNLRSVIESLGQLAQAVPSEAKVIIPRLLEILRDKDYSVRSDAKRALAMVVQAVPSEAKALIPKLLEILKDDKDYRVRRAAKIALAMVAQAVPSEAKALIPKLLEILKDDKDYQVRRAAKIALAMVAQAVPGEAKAIIPTLLEILGDRDLSVHRSTVLCLSRIAQAVPDQAESIMLGFQKALGDENSLVNHYLVESLVKVAQALPELAEKSIAILEKGTKGKYPVSFHSLKRAFNTFPVQQLIAVYLANPKLKGLEPFIKDRLYRESLIIRPSLQLDGQELVIYPSSGKPISLPISQEQAETLMALCNSPVVQTKEDEAHTTKGDYLNRFGEAQNSTQNSGNHALQQQKKKKKEIKKKKRKLFY